MISNVPSQPIASYGGDPVLQSTKAASLPQVGADVALEEQTFIRRPVVPPSQTQEFRDFQTLTLEQRRKLIEVREKEGRASRESGRGRFSGAKSFHSQLGADGHEYISAGWRPHELSPVPNDAAGTVAKMRAVRRAELVPAGGNELNSDVARNAERAIRAAQSTLIEAELNRDVEVSIQRLKSRNVIGSVASLIRSELVGSSSRNTDAGSENSLAMNDELSRLLASNSEQSGLKTYISGQTNTEASPLSPGTLLSLVA
jgi:hypothetical protein